jgi:N utilization substance protein B
MGVRRKAREEALQVLFGLEFNPRVPEVAVAEFIRNREEIVEDDPYLGRLVVGVWRRLEELNELIRRHSTNWRLERMAVVDKNILRIASYELTAEMEVPHKVIINEAIEIAKKYGSEDSPAFVNGVLDRIALESRPDQMAEDAGAEEPEPQDQDAL